MAIPSAAGFIPNQSAVGDLARIIDLFGHEGKDRRAAETGRLKAETQNIMDMINWRPDQSAQNWEQLRMQAEKNGWLPDESARQWSAIDANNQDRAAQEGRFWGGTLPLQQGQQALDQNQHDEIARHNRAQEAYLPDESAQHWAALQNQQMNAESQRRLVDNSTDQRKNASEQIRQLLSNPNFLASIPENMRRTLGVGILAQDAQASENPAADQMFEQMRRQAAELSRIGAEAQQPASSRVSPMLQSILGDILTGGTMGLMNNTRSVFGGSNPLTESQQAAPQQQQDAHGQPPASTPAPMQQHRIPSTMRLPSTQPPPSGVIEGRVPAQEPALPQNGGSADIWDMISPGALKGGAPSTPFDSESIPHGTNPSGFPPWLMQYLGNVASNLNLTQ
jgi:hypothetical protein